MIIKDSKWPPKRFEALRGSLMIDISRGQVRVRKWPRKRGPPKTEEHRKNTEIFAQANRAYKYLPPLAQTWLMNQTEGSPLLPRDLLTAMMFNQLATFQLDTGKVLYPMSDMLGVSESLDTISQDEGSYLKRGEKLWEATKNIPANGFTLIERKTVTTPTNSLDFQSIPQTHGNLMLIGLLRSDRGSSAETAVLTVNGVGSSDYATQRWEEDGSISNLAQAWSYLTRAATTGGSNGTFTPVFGIIPAYSSSDLPKAWISIGGYRDASEMASTINTGALQGVNDAVSDLQVNAVGGDWTAKTVLDLYAF